MLTHQNFSRLLFVFCFLILVQSGVSANTIDADEPTWDEMTRYHWLQDEATAASQRMVQETVSAESDYTIYIPAITHFGHAASRSAVANFSLTADINDVQHPISPYIYGINLAPEDAANQWQLPINRWGGNALTRYNWEIDVFNPGNYWYFENLNNYPELDTFPVGTSADRYVEQNMRTNSASLIQVPMIGWTPKDRADTCGFHWDKYGWQSDTDWSYRWGCGNGIHGGTGEYITGNDPADTSAPVDETFAQAWIEHLVSQFGDASNGGVEFYSLDNEPMIWHFNHRDVHPEYPSYDEVLSKGIAHASAIKTADPNAKVMGPGVWGWVSYFNSAIDLNTPDSNPDRDQYGLDFIPWYLQEMRKFEEENGYRLLDYLDIHYYPQAYTDEGAVALLPGGDETTQALRLRSTKDLWDETYTSESWINEPTYVIPRMQAWIDEYYPGTRLVMSEYRWGGLDIMNGALTQADVLGIYGREDLEMAMLWDVPALGQPGDFAIRMYRDYDGAGSTFGDLSLSASSTDQDQLVMYAAKDSADSAVTLMIINKTKNPIDSDVILNNFGDGEARVYQYSPADLGSILSEDPVTFVNGQTSGSFPAESITLYVLSDSPPPPADPEEIIYDDQLAPDWTTDGWGWQTSYNLAHAQTVHSGSNAIRVLHNAAWAGFYIHSDTDIAYDNNDVLRFWIHGGTAGTQPVRLYLIDSNYQWGPQIIVPYVEAGYWRQVEFPLSTIAPDNGPALFNGIIWLNGSGSPQPEFFLDDISIVRIP